MYSLILIQLNSVSIVWIIGTLEPECDSDVGFLESLDPDC